MSPELCGALNALDELIAAAAPKKVPALAPTDSKTQRETIIRIGYGDDGSRVVSLYSTQPAWWRKAERAGWKEVVRDGGGREYEAPADQLRLSLRTADSVAKDRASRSEAMKRISSAKTAMGLAVLGRAGKPGRGRV